MKFLGIDIGSTFLKSSILDLDEGRVLSASGKPTPAFAEKDLTGRALDPARKEIPIRTLAAAVKDLIDDAAETQGIEGVVFSVQMHGFALFDPSGEPVTNYISWQDTRGVMPTDGGISVLEELRGGAWKPYFEEDGVLLRPNHSVIPLTHCARERGIAPGTQFAMIGDAVMRLLTGERTAIHPTNAASSGLYSLRRGAWNRELLDKLGLGALDMPAVRDSREAETVYTAPNGAEIPLYAALGDQQATVLGIGIGTGDVFINIGTGGQIGYAAAEPVPGPYETRPFFGGSFLRTVTQLPSGRTINVLMNFLKGAAEGILGENAPAPEETEKRLWAYLDGLDPDKDGAAPLTMDLSFFGPEGGSISGMTDSTFTVGNLFRSLYLSFAQEYADKAALLNISEESPGEVVCTGGVIRKNRALFACIREAFPRPCRIAACTDDAMEGLLRFARACAFGEPVL